MDYNSLRNLSHVHRHAGRDALMDTSNDIFTEIHDSLRLAVLTEYTIDELIHELQQRGVRVVRIEDTEDNPHEGTSD